jgi:ADP-ribose pyrophosphatase YjhB (NUDIX family)
MENFEDHIHKNKTLAAGIIPICNGKMLLSKRAPHVMFPNSWASWGGKVEIGVDKTFKDCAIREFREETKCEVPFEIDQPFHVYEDDRVLYVTNVAEFHEEFVTYVSSETALVDSKWVAFDKLPEDLMPEFKVMLYVCSDKIEKLLYKTAQKN